MTELEVMPGEGFVDLRLGDDKTAVRHRFGTFRTFRRTQDSPETDQFIDSGMLVTYGPEEEVTLIEVTPPAEPTIRGVRLLRRPLTEVLDELRAVGLTVVTDQDGASVDEWRVGLYAPSGVVEGVSIGE